MTRQDLRLRFQKRFRALQGGSVGFALALCGPPGIGKSHTAAGALLGLKGVVRLRANASGPELARAWRTGPRLPEWVSRVLALLEEGQQLGAPDCVRAFSAALALQSPGILLLEDLHECSPERRLLWTLLARNLRENRGVALLCTSRGTAPPEFESIWLEPLQQGELREIFAGESAVPPPQTVRGWLAQRSGGNPLFALEFLRDLRRRGELWLDGETWRWRGGQHFAPIQNTLPSSLEALVERTLNALSGEAARLLEVRTLLSEDLALPDAFPPELWGALSGLEASRLALAQRELEQAGILRGGDWSHALFFEVARQRVPPEVRGQDAARAIRILESHHPLLAASLVAVARWQGAAALEVYARAILASPMRAAALRWELLALPHHPPETRVSQALALLERLSGSSFSQEAVVLDRALEVDPSHLELVSRRARLWMSQGKPEKAKPALEALPRRDGAWWLEWMKLLFALGEHASALALWDGRPELREVVGAGWASSMVKLLAYQGRFEEGLDLAERWLQRPSLSKRDAARLHNARGVLFQTQGKAQEALVDYHHALALCEQCEAGDTARLAQGNAAMIHNFLGQYAQAETLFAQAAQSMLEAGDLSGYAATQTVRAGNRSDQGNFEQAETLLLEAYAILGHGEASFERIECEIFLARMYALWGLPLHAALSLRYAYRALEHARRQGGRTMLHRALEGAALCEARVGDPGRALDLLEEYRAKLQLELDALSPEAQLYRALALERLGRLSEAVSLLEQVYGSCPDPLIGLELDRLKGNREAAQARGAIFTAQGFGLGLHLLARYFPAPSPSPKASAWRLEVLGPLRLSHRGTPHRLGGEKRKLLLALLLEAHLSGQSELSGEELSGVLYPNSGQDEARVALKQLVFQVRTALEPDLIRTTPRGYALTELHSDAQDFLESSNTRLWRGAYLQDVRGLGGLGFGSVGEGMAERLRRVGFELLENPKLSTELIREVARVARILLEMDPYDAAALELGLRALRGLGHYTALHRLFERAKTHWLEVNEPLAAHWSTFLALREASRREASRKGVLCFDSAEQATS